MPPRVLVSLSDETQEYQALEAREGRAAAQRLGIDLQVDFCQGIPVRQLKVLTDAIDAPAGARPVAIVIHANSVAALEPMAFLALKAGIGWFVLDETKYLAKLRQAFPQGLVGMVTGDNRAIGVLQGRFVRALLPSGGSIVCLEGPGISPISTLRREGLLQELGPDFKVLQTVSGDWSVAGGERALAGWLQFTTGKERPLLVASQNDAMAVGARKAMEAMRPQWGELLYVGCDGLPEGGQRLVREKKLSGTVVQSPSVPRALELVARWLGGEKIPLTTVQQPTVYPTLEEVALGRRR